MGLSASIASQFSPSAEVLNLKSTSPKFIKTRLSTVEDYQVLGSKNVIW